MAKYGKFVALLVAAVLAVSMVALSGCSTPTPAATPTTPAAAPAADLKLVTPGQITVGSDTSFPPFESLNGNVVEGFDVELMTAIAKEMGINKVVFQTEGFDTLIASLKGGGKYDVIVSGMFINDERKLSVDFSDPYGVANQGITVKTGSAIKKPEDLAGKKVAVQSGTTGETWVKENVKTAIRVPFKTATDEIVALQAGNVDAAVNDAPVMQFLSKDPSKGITVVTEAPTAELYGIAVSKDNPALLKAINAGLAKVKASGEYDTLYLKWFGVAPSK
jgi:polar amino acid transport system substrate-binding protein